MKTKHIFWGTLFISIGLLSLLNNFDLINFYWSDLWQFWPVVLILWGVAIVLKGQLLKGILAGISGLLLALIIFTIFRGTFGIINDNFNWNDKDFSVRYDDSNNIRKYNESYDPSIKQAVFHFNSGAGAFYIGDTTSDLISAVSNNIDYNFSVVKNSVDEADVYLKWNDDNHRFRYKKSRNKSNIELNSNPVWNLDCDLGAASMNFDLTKYKIKDVDIEMGAASLRMKLGNLYDETHVRIKGGVSSIEIYVPDNSACEIISDNSLSSKNYHGFKKVFGRTYRTDNFDTATKKIYLDINADISSVKVSRTSGW